MEKKSHFVAHQLHVAIILKKYHELQLGSFQASRALHSQDILYAQLAPFEKRFDKNLSSKSEHGRELGSGWKSIKGDSDLGVRLLFTGEIFRRYNDLVDELVAVDVIEILADIRQPVGRIK